jgi:hypothetical protein
MNDGMAAPHSLYFYAHILSFRRFYGRSAEKYGWPFNLGNESRSLIYAGTTKECVSSMWLYEERFTHENTRHPIHEWPQKSAKGARGSEGSGETDVNAELTETAEDRRTSQVERQSSRHLSSQSGNRKARNQERFTSRSMRAADCLAEPRLTRRRAQSRHRTWRTERGGATCFPSGLGTSWPLFAYFAHFCGCHPVNSWRLVGEWGETAEVTQTVATITPQAFYFSFRAIPFSFRAIFFSFRAIFGAFRAIYFSF